MFRRGAQRGTPRLATKKSQICKFHPIRLLRHYLEVVKKSKKNLGEFSSMKLTKEKLKKIISEEIGLAVSQPVQEQEDGEEVMAAIADVPKAAAKIAEKVKKDIEALAEPSGLDPLVLAQAVAALLTVD